MMLMFLVLKESFAALLKCLFGTNTTILCDVWESAGHVSPLWDVNEMQILRQILIIQDRL